MSYHDVLPASQTQSFALVAPGLRGEGPESPDVDCITFTRNEVGFCDVSSRAVQQMVDMQTK